MAAISDAGLESFLEINTEIQAIKGAFLEDAAQKFTGLLFRHFSESTVLARLFATVPFGKLPQKNQGAVRSLATSANVLDSLRDDTPVLSLLGTSGVRPEWNNRGHSRGHVGIPLASAAFVDSVPMLSRMLKELGMELDWLEKKDEGIARSLMGRLSGLFYVQDAAAAFDQKGRKIIAAQDFVQANQVKTVFGMGGAYPASDSFLVIILFTREILEKSKLDSFPMLLNTFKMTTHDLGVNGKVFASL